MYAVNLKDKNSKYIKKKVDNQEKKESPYKKQQVNNYDRPPLGQQSPLRLKQGRSNQDQQIQNIKDSKQYSLYQKEAQMEERHEQLKKQIAIKEKLLADMNSERESARRLRYSKNNLGNSFNKDTLNIERRGRDIFQTDNMQLSSNYPMSSSPLRNKQSQEIIGVKSPQLKSQSFLKDIPSMPKSLNNQKFRINNPQSFKQTFISPPTLKQNSPLRMKNINQKSVSRSPTNLSKERDSPSKNVYNPRVNLPMILQRSSPLKNKMIPQQQNEKSNSPLRQSKNVQFNRQIEQIISPRTVLNMRSIEEKEKILVERIETITLENSALQRRVKNASDDLKAIKQHREELVNIMKKFMKENDILHRSVNQKDELDMLNKNLQSDLELIRDSNRKLEKLLFAEQLQASQQEKILNNTSYDKQYQIQDANSISAELQRKFQILENLAKAHTDVLSKINLINIEIENISKEDTGSNQFNINLTKIVTKLSSERYELNVKVQALSEEYQDLVKSTILDRKQLNQNFRRQSNFITCRIIENGFIKIIKRLKQECFFELQEYCTFDKNCHYKLKQFAMVSNKLAKLGNGNSTQIQQVQIVNILQMEIIIAIKSK